MARGANAGIGDERVSQNGYHYTKTAEDGWVLTHRMIAEKELLGRRLREDERVTFINGNKRDIRPENLRVTQVRSTLARLKKRHDDIEVRIVELRAQQEDIMEEIQRRELNGET